VFGNLQRKNWSVGGFVLCWEVPPKNPRIEINVQSTFGVFLDMLVSLSWIE